MEKAEIGARSAVLVRQALRCGKWLRPGDAEAGVRAAQTLRRERGRVTLADLPSLDLHQLCKQPGNAVTIAAGSGPSVRWTAQKPTGSQRTTTGSVVCNRASLRAPEHCRKIALASRLLR